MKHTIGILFLLLSVNLYPQKNIDSLLMALETATDTGRLYILKELCWESRYNHPPEAMEYGLQALALAQQFKMYEEEASINNYLGVVQRNFGDYAKALEYYSEALGIAEEHQVKREYAYANNNIGDIYNIEEKYEQALDYELMALKAFEELGNNEGISYCCHQLALVHANLNQFSEAIEYDTRAMKIRELMGNEAGVAYSLIHLGETFLKLGMYKASLDSLMKSRQIFSDLKDKFGLAFADYNIGLYYQLVGDPKKAEEYIKNAMDLGKEIKSTVRVKNSARILSEIYAGQRKFEKAYEMYKLYKEKDDSLYRRDNLVKITQLEMQHDYQQRLKEQEFEQRQREILQQAEIDRQKQLRNYLIVCCGLILILVVVLFNRNYIKKKANIELLEKNKEIESQKKELEHLFVSLRVKNDELSQQKDEIITQNDNLLMLNNELENQKNELQSILKELKQTQTQLIQSEKMASVGVLTAGVAHELNNPINFITGNIKPLQRNIEDIIHILSEYDSIVEKKKLSADFTDVERLKKTSDYEYLIKETQDLLKGIHEGASRSEQIVKGLRNFTRLDEEEFKPTDIHEGIDSTLVLLQNRIQDRIQVHKKYGDIPKVECLPGKLNQVFMNILANSIQAIEKEGEISIETSCTDSCVNISISDTGKGMTPEIKDHIFEPFFTTRPVGEGTGLGLSISYGIIEQHDGKIEVSSEPGNGTEFIITIPVRKKN